MVMFGGEPLTKLMMGSVLTDEHGNLYVVVGLRRINYSFLLTEIPEGMDAKDLGRRFEAWPLLDDYAKARVIESDGETGPREAADRKPRRRDA